MAKVKINFCILLDTVTVRLRNMFGIQSLHQIHLKDVQFVQILDANFIRKLKFDLSNIKMISEFMCFDFGCQLNVLNVKFLLAFQLQLKCHGDSLVTDIRCCWYILHNLFFIFLIRVSQFLCDCFFQRFWFSNFNIWPIIFTQKKCKWN